MKIASYNIFNGAKESLPQLEEFVKQQDLDILCLQEANDWLDGSPSQLDQFAATTGLVHTISGGNTRFKIATLSRLPFTKSTFHSEGFWHGAVETEIETPEGIIDVWNTHLRPHAEDYRIPEARYITNHIDIDKQTLIVGDLNSLSEADGYDNDLAQKLSTREVDPITKFGTTHNRYDVTRMMTDRGLYDIAVALESLTNTVPTPANTDKNHADKLRLDYMFASESLLKRVESITVPKTELTDQISDHYPQILTLN